MCTDVALDGKYSRVLKSLLKLPFPILPSFFVVLLPLLAISSDR